MSAGEAIRSDARLLVFEGHDPAKRETFYRPLGGGIEFHERGSDAVARELREEIGAEIHNIRYLGLLENILVYGGAPKHELVLVFEADLVDEAFYAPANRVGYENDGSPFQVTWLMAAEGFFQPFGDDRRNDFGVQHHAGWIALS